MRGTCASSHVTQRRVKQHANPPTEDMFISQKKKRLEQCTRATIDAIRNLHDLQSNE